MTSRSMLVPTLAGAIIVSGFAFAAGFMIGHDDAKAKAEQRHPLDKVSELTWSRPPIQVGVYDLPPNVGLYRDGEDRAYLSQSIQLKREDEEKLRAFLRCKP